MNEYEKEEQTRAEADLPPEEASNPLAGEDAARTSDAPAAQESPAEPQASAPAEPPAQPNWRQPAPEPAPGQPRAQGYQQPQGPGGCCPGQYPPPRPQGQWQGGAYQYPQGPNTTGWQQPPQWQQPYTTGWGPQQYRQPQQPGQSPWQGGGYRPQNQTHTGEAVPGQWEPSGEEDYDEDDAPRGRKKGGVLRVLLRIAAVAAALAVVTMAGYGVYVAATGENPLQNLEPGMESIGGGSGGGNSVPDVNLNDRPSGGADQYDGAESGTLPNTAIFNKVSPSVVGVIVRQGESLYSGAGQGSGVIMSEDGYIITNAHVVDDADHFEVVMADGESCPAQLVGADRNTDLAVLKVEKTGLTAAEFGNSDQLEIGERVCVIGNPGMQLQNTLTVGYVSALDRTINVRGYSINCIQTDAAINPGNSGGPLIDAYGRVVGISSAKIVLEGYEGICFAIPISDAMPIIKQLIADGKVTGRALLGITATAVKASEAEYYEIPLGLWVATITPGADIGAKGVREGDIITHVADTPVYSLDACSTVLKDYKPGDTVSVTVFRRESSMRDTTFKVDVVLSGS